jgi:hypothetical protein
MFDRALESILAGNVQRATIRGVRVVHGDTVKWKCPCCGSSGAVRGDDVLVRVCLVTFIQRHLACWGASDTIPP